MYLIEDVPEQFFVQWSLFIIYLYGMFQKVEEEELAGASGGSAGTGSDNDADDKEPGKDKKKKNRCAVCRKKVGLTGKSPLLLF